MSNLLSIIELNGKKWVSSKKLHEDLKPTSSVAATNRAIREMPSYSQLVEEGHIYNLRRELDRDAEIASLIKSNSYNPIMLIDPVAQKEIEHHFHSTTNQAIKSSKENAILGTLGIDLSLVDPQRMALITLLAEQAKMEHQQKILNAEQDKIRTEQFEQRIMLLELKHAQENFLLTQGDGGFYTVRAYSVITKNQINLSEAKAIGKIASNLCKTEGINTGDVPDERYGRVKTYPKEVLDQAFEDYFTEE
jgi:hypothetical protein